MKNKKIIIAVLTIFVILFAMINTSFAANSFSLNMTPNTTKVEKGQELKISLKLSAITVSEGLTSISATLKYDSDSLSISNDGVQGTGNFTVDFKADTNKISFTSAEPVTEGGEIATITFKVKENTSANVAKIELASITGGNDDTGEVSISNISTMVTLSTPGSEDPSEQPTGDPVPVPTESPTTTVQPSQTTTVTNDPNMPSTGTPQDYALPLLGIIAILGIAAFVNYKKLDKSE